MSRALAVAQVVLIEERGKNLVATLACGHRRLMRRQAKHKRAYCLECEEANHE